ncbi:MAG: nucleotidyltransferase domain-containing protein [Gammaproteobacteria bacterium]|jgi:predicted nucleotidyltransferase|nr:nucleotidyltransferase domain-containing protein [Gammaproteobacteria bacterium]HJO10642.1 nucleotidyltransferase domain-containing protein [Gammaproteobacteria bacterium]|tara:strand:- start:337 stop:933 length:597 start_codon:yes stop_codon:yes gene_type:complete
MATTDIKSMGDALFTKTQQKVLALLFGNLKESYYLNEIVRLANVGKGTIKRELESMRAAGLITVSRIGNQTHYQANKTCPIFDELRGIVRKTFGVAQELTKALNPIASSVQFAFVYGSLAKGSDTPQSDIDLMIIGNDFSYTDVMELLIPAESTLARPVNPTVYSAQQFKKKLAAKNSFLTRVMAQEKIIVMGSEDAI